VARTSGSPRRLGDRAGREIDPSQAGTRHAREPQTDPATAAAQVDEVIAWREPQLGEDAIEALACDEREWLHARGKGPSIRSNSSFVCGASEIQANTSSKTSGESASSSGTVRRLPLAMAHHDIRGK
jgi:hypothetical protein